MAQILPFGRRAHPVTGSDALRAFLGGFSIEVMPRTAEKIPDFRTILPAGTRVYIAHIEGVPIEDMTRTAARLLAEGFPVMPHIPARLVPNRATLEDWLRRYRDLGVEQALILAGGARQPAGDYTSSMEMLETGLFDTFGFTRLHVAGHPEGNKDIDPDGSDRNVIQALRWKTAFTERTDAAMAITTQFAFEPAPIIAWADRLQAESIHLPIHIGIAGPAKLQTLIKFAMACGVGPSLRVLTRRAADLTQMVRPFTPDAVLTALAEHKAAHPGFNIVAPHIFPLGGIGPAADYLNDRLGTRSAAAARA
ncbi:MAG: methylenetetrahydrofolate reductase [Pseudomonadota bacterium]